MICFRDRAWCSDLCAGCAPNCDRLLTDEVRAAADQWWGRPDAPIAIRPPRREEEGTEG